MYRFLAGEQMNPYILTGPTVISFSGGRTSGYMLAAIVAAHGGKLPADARVVFTNTGKEFPETLDFVRDVGGFFGVPIHWVEYRPPAERGGVRHVEVDYETASRNGEPYAALIEEKNFLPNPVMRFCTTELKVNTMRDYIKHACKWPTFANVIGLRADEMNRVSNMERRNASPENRDPWRSTAPLAAAGVVKADVAAFWAAQSFDLALRPHESNCDLCFLKGAGTASAIIRERPHMAEWWIDQEARTVRGKERAAEDSLFRHDRPSYAALAEGVRLQSAFNFGVFDDLTTCEDNACTD